MSETRTGAKKRRARTQGVKALIAAAAVSATIGGWGILSVSEAGASAPANPPAPAIQSGLPQGGEGQTPGFGPAPSAGQFPSFGGRHRNRSGSLPSFGGTAPSTQNPGSFFPGTQDPGTQSPSAQSPSTQLPMPFTRSRSSR